MKTIPSLAANFSLALALVALPTLNADPAVESARSQAATAEVDSAERKASLAAIDSDIEAIENSLLHAPDAAARNEARVRLDALKKRRAELRKNYAVAKAAELRADAILEYRKAVAWTKDTVADARHAVTGSTPGSSGSDSGSATADPQAGAAAANLELYRLNPSAENKAEVKAALDALDDEIDRLEEHADAMPRGPERVTLQKRVKALEARQEDLEASFSRARWDALVADLKAEWSRIAK